MSMKNIRTTQKCVTLYWIFSLVRNKGSANIIAYDLHEAV
jgi:hypothetical protein